MTLPALNLYIFIFERNIPASDECFKSFQLLSTFKVYTS